MAENYDRLTEINRGFPCHNRQRKSSPKTVSYTCILTNLIYTISSLPYLQELIAKKGGFVKPSNSLTAIPLIWRMWDGGSLADGHTSKETSPWLIRLVIRALTTIKRCRFQKVLCSFGVDRIRSNAQRASSDT